MKIVIIISYTILENSKSSRFQPICVLLLTKIKNFFSPSLVHRRIRIRIRNSWFSIWGSGSEIINFGSGTLWQKYDLRFWPPKKVWRPWFICFTFFDNGIIIIWRQNFEEGVWFCFRLFEIMLTIHSVCGQDTFRQKRKWQSQKLRDLFVEKNHVNSLTQEKDINKAGLRIRNY